jgi:hypothetical protein
LIKFHTTTNRGTLNFEVLNWSEPCDASRLDDDDQVPLQRVLEQYAPEMHVAFLNASGRAFICNAKRRAKGTDEAAVFMAGSIISGAG